MYSAPLLIYLFRQRWNGREITENLFLLSFRRECTVEINNQLVAKALSGNKKDAKTLASDAALEQLRKECHTLKVR